ncbi:hypothetical protein ACFL5V_08810 [Fibrobacterota bacterium]
MSYKILGSIFVTLLLITGCSTSKSSRGSQGQGNLLEVLTDFSIALNKNNFREALDYLIEDEKMQLIQPDQSISSESKKQLKALRLQKLIKNPKIKLVQGKLVGIVESLPSLEHTGPDNPPEPVESPAEDEGGEAEEAGIEEEQSPAEPAMEDPEAELDEFETETDSEQTIEE